jgi:TPR repeat protein
MAPRRSAAWLCLLLTVAPWAAAAPEDDHRLGVAAYRRGDVVGAMAALRPAARAGHAASQVKLAFILESADFAQEASRLYAAAAEQGSAEGHAGLAALLLAGRGIAKDEKRAAQHFSKAAEAGHLLAAEILAKAYRTGGMGLAIDPVEAARWEQRSAELRSAAAGTGPER